MVEPNDRVTEARQDAFRESRRHTPAHDVMGKSIGRAECQHDQAQAR
jgi:hypothetical protein